MGDVIDACIQGAQDAGADTQTTTCISVACGAVSGMDTCPVIEHSANWAISAGASEEDANNWAQESTAKVYDWYVVGTC